MSAAQVLTEARAIGIHVEVDGNDLLLEAVAPPPSALLEALSRHKAEIIAMLQPGADGWSIDDWRFYFEERAAVAEFNGGLTRADAEVQAFECCIIQWMNRNPAASAPGRSILKRSAGHNANTYQIQLSGSGQEFAAGSSSGQTHSQHSPYSPGQGREDGGLGKEGKDFRVDGAASPNAKKAAPRSSARL